MQSMPHNRLERKMKDAAIKAADPSLLSKEHVVVTYSFNGKQGQRILRCEGENSFSGEKQYYDYHSGKTGTLQSLSRSWGAVNLRVTHSADMVNLKVSKTETLPSNEEAAGPPLLQPPAPPVPDTARTITPPNISSPGQGQGGANAPSSPGNSRPLSPGQGSPRARQQSPGQQRTSSPRLGRRKKDSPIKPSPPDKFEIPAELPQGRMAPKKKIDALAELSGDVPFFNKYLQVFYGDGPMRCASGAWGLIMPYLLAEKGKAAVIMPVSTWKLKAQVKKTGISSLVTERQVSLKTNADFHNLLANKKDLSPGTVITLDSGHSYDGKCTNDPSHTMVYGGYGLWLDNRTNAEITQNRFSPVVQEKAWAEFKKRTTALAGIYLSDSEMASLSGNGGWLARGHYFVAKEDGEYCLYNSKSGYTQFQKGREIRAPSVSEESLRSALQDKRAIITSTEVSRLNSLRVGESAIINTELGNKLMFSNAPGGRQKAIELFGYDVFSSPPETPIPGLDGRVYTVRSEISDPKKKTPVLNVYSSPNDIVYHIVTRVPGGFELSSKKNELLEYFSWCGNSGVYDVDFSKMPPAKQRVISSKDFGIEKMTPEGFASLLSQAYGIMFEYAFNEIMRQNPGSSARRYVPGLTVSLSVALPEAKLGRILAVPIERIETPTSKKMAEWLKRQASYSSTDEGALKYTAVLKRRDEFFRRCAEIDSIFRKLDVRAQSVDALKVILFNEMYGSGDKEKWAERVTESYSRRQGFKSLSRNFFGISGQPGYYLDSWGFFQTNINYVLKYLDGYTVKKDKASGKMSEVIYSELGRQRRAEVITKLSGIPGSAESVALLGQWSGAGLSERRREVVAQLLEKSMPFAIYFANMLYFENYRICQENADKNLGRNYTSTDHEMTAVFAYNHGIVRANNAIFQQNLLIVAGNLAAQNAKSPDPKKQQAASDIVSILKKFTIDGTLAADGYSESATCELFKRVCLLKGIASFQGHDPQKMSYRDFSIAFGTPSLPSNGYHNNYKDMAAFFKLPQFSGKDFHMKDDPLSASPCPFLKYSYVSSKEGKLHASGYLKSYVFFISPAEAKGEAEGPKYVQTLKASSSGGKIKVDYTVPNSPGPITITVKNSKGRLVHKFTEKAEQREGHFQLSTLKQPNGAYIVDYAVGGKHISQVVVVRGSYDYVPQKDYAPKGHGRQPFI